MRVAGIMSGTSLDGIDVAIVDIAGRSISTVAFAGTPYPAAVREAVLAVSNAVTTTGDIARLNFRLGELYARAVRETCRRRSVPLDSVERLPGHTKQEVRFLDTGDIEGSMPGPCSPRQPPYGTPRSRTP